MRDYTEADFQQLVAARLQAQSINPELEAAVRALNAERQRRVGLERVLEMQRQHIAMLEAKLRRLSA